MVGDQPAVERPLPSPFPGEQHRQRHDLTRVQLALTMFRLVAQLVVYPAEQLCDKINSGHEHLLLVCLLWSVFTSSLVDSHGLLKLVVRPSCFDG